MGQSWLLQHGADMISTPEVQSQSQHCWPKPAPSTPLRLPNSLSSCGGNRTLVFDHSNFFSQFVPVCQSVPEDVSVPFYLLNSQRCPPCMCHIHLHMLLKTTPFYPSALGALKAPRGVIASAAQASSVVAARKTPPLKCARPTMHGTRLISSSVVELALQLKCLLASLSSWGKELLAAQQLYNCVIRDVCLKKSFQKFLHSCHLPFLSMAFV